MRQASNHYADVNAGTLHAAIRHVNIQGIELLLARGADAECPGGAQMAAALFVDYGADTRLAADLVPQGYGSLDELVVDGRYRFLEAARPSSRSNSAVFVGSLDSQAWPLPVPMAAAGSTLLGAAR